MPTPCVVAFQVEVFVGSRFLAPIVAMPRLDVCLQWAVSGCVVKTWCGVPTHKTLGDLVSDELDDLPGEMRIIHQSREVGLLDELQMVTASVDNNVLTLDLVRIHAYKRNIIQIMPYICLDGFTAVRMSDLGMWLLSRRIRCASRTLLRPCATSLWVRATRTSRGRFWPS